MSGSEVNAVKREMVVWRDYDATQPDLFRAFLDRGQIASWWGPRGFTTTISEMDARPGGVWRFVMHGPDGRDYPNLVVYVEVSEPGRLVYDHGVDEDGAPRMFRQTIDFTNVPGGARVTMRLDFDTAEEFDRNMKMGAVEGGLQTLERLAEYLAEKRG